MGQRLLVLDADDKFIDEHRAALEFNFDVDFVDSPENVIKMLDGGDYRAILIGLEIDKNRGYEVCAGIRNRASLSSFKIAIISSEATESDFAKHSKLRVRADLYLSKPIATSALVSALGTFIPPKARALDNTLDVLMGVDIGEEWLESLNSVEPSKGSKAVGQLMGLAAQSSSPESKIRELESELQAKTAKISEFQRENQELRQETEKQLALCDGLENRIRELESGLRVSAEELSKAQQENQELQHQNADITLKLQELEKWQKNTEGIQRRLQEAEDQLKHLESSSLEDSADEILRTRFKEIVEEKQALLLQLEALTQEIAEKNQQAVAFLQVKQDLHQQLLDVEESKRRIEQEFETRVESERNLLMARIDNFQDSGAAIRKRIGELEESCTAKTRELKSAQNAHNKEKRRLIRDFESQVQNMASLFNAQQEKIRIALGAVNEAEKNLTELLASDIAVEGDA